MSRFRVIRGYDDGTGAFQQEGSQVKASLEDVLNGLEENEVVVSVQEHRLNSGNTYFTIVVEDIDVRLPSLPDEEEETD